MIISLQAFATLGKFMPPNADAYEMPSGASIADLLEKLGLKQEDVKLVFINGAHVSLDAAISEGDRVGLFPAVGGG